MWAYSPFLSSVHHVVKSLNPSPYLVTLDVRDDKNKKKDVNDNNTVVSDAAYNALTFVQALGQVGAKPPGRVKREGESGGVSWRPMPYNEKIKRARSADEVREIGHSAGGAVGGDEGQVQEEAEAVAEGRGEEEKCHGELVW